MTDLEKFLRQASRGLWGRERQTVRQELESHIRHRANRYEVSGSSEIDAIKLAIADLGEPRAINSGMRGVYSVPSTIRVGVVSAVMAASMFMGIQLSTAQVTGTTKFLTPACVEQQQNSFKLGNIELPCDGNDFSVQLESLRSVLEPLGVQFDIGEISTVIKWPEKAYSILTTESVQSFIQREKPLELIPIPPARGFIPLFNFFDALRSSGLPVQISGWDSPKISVGQTKFTLGSTTQPVPGSSVYPTLLNWRLDMLTSVWAEKDFYTESPQTSVPSESKVQTQPNVHIKGYPQVFKHRIRTTLEPGSIAIVMSRESQVQWTIQNKPYTNPKHRHAFIAPVGPDGSIEYPSFSRSLAVVNPRDVQVGIHNGHATISVLRFSGEYSNNPTMLEVVKPEAIKIQSR
jgi:hypothetical protein